MFKRPRQKDGDYLAWIREMCCCICKKPGVDPAHIRTAALEYGKRHTGLGQKPDDTWVVPLCREHHDLQHSMKEAAFWHAYKINPYVLALSLRNAAYDNEMAELILERQGWSK